MGGFIIETGTRGNNANVLDKPIFTIVFRNLPSITAPRGFHAIISPEMKSVVLVEPDRKAAERLAAGFPWEASGFCVAGILGAPPLEAEGQFAAPCLVISEITFPGRTARQALQALRAAWPSACLAVLTGDRRLVSAQEAFRHGVIRYLAKPLSPGDLAELLEAVAGRTGIAPIVPAVPGGGAIAGDEGIARRVQAYVDVHFRDSRLTLKAIAETFHLNYSYLSFLFKKHTGQKYSAYVGALRIRHARMLLGDTCLTLSEVARASGFRDAQILYYAFKSATGVTPRAFREQRPPGRAADEPLNGVEENLS
jgi:AraC-like DNA-binding protein